MKILVVGGGGREHALCWKIAGSPLVDEVICAPGNAGIAEIADCVPIPVSDHQKLIELAKERGVQLTVIGPEGPLCDGIVDMFQAEKMKIFGPNRMAAEIEGSKAFARRLCRRNRIPQPGYWIFEEYANAQAFLENRQDGPIVVKASGLAAGKGVTVAAGRSEAMAALRECMEGKRFGDAGQTVIFEDRLEGPEVSVMCITDGRTLVPLETVGDHKQVFDGDQGPNTGGMGAVSPVRSVMSRAIDQIEAQILLPAVHGLNREDRMFQGILYVGLMMTHAGPRVLEFNCRFGDPETQPLLMRLKSDLVPYLLHVAEGSLEELSAPEWDPRPAVCVMATSQGYPGEYSTGVTIHGLDDVETGPDLQIFHSGTARRVSNVVTAGGRVLSTCALGATLEEARTMAYRAMERIEFRGMHFRRDIGRRFPATLGSDARPQRGQAT